MIAVLALSLCTLLVAVGVGLWSYRLRRQNLGLRDQNDRLAAENDHLAEERRRLSGQTQGLQEEYGRVRGQLAGRPQMERRVYNIVTVGTTACGKTALTFRWAKPTFKLEELVATRFQRFERTVSHQWIPEQGKLVDHVFQILDWGGEHITQAQADLILLESIHAMLLVVDLGEYDPATRQQVVSAQRIRAQIQMFNPHVLRLFFESAEIISHCRTYVVFINKADLLAGTWAEIEQKAKEHFRPLLDAVMKYDGKNGISVRVIVGSAQIGHNTPELYGHLIERIVPKDAYDEQLRASLEGESLRQADFPTLVTTKADLAY